MKKLDFTNSFDRSLNEECNVTGLKRCFLKHPVSLQNVGGRGGGLIDVVVGMNFNK